MNGARTTFMRRGYLLTALAAVVLLAASPGTASAQRVTVGFDGTSGSISENAYINNDALAQPQMVTVRINGLATGSRRAGDITAQLGTNVTITPNAAVYIATVGAGGVFGTAADYAPTGATNTALQLPSATTFASTDVISLVVAQSEAGAGDNNWRNEMIELKLTVDGSASVSPDVFTITIQDRNVAPVATFQQSSFTLTEGAERDVALDIVSGDGRAMPGAALAIATNAATQAAVLTVRVSNHRMVNTGACVTDPDATGYGAHAVGLNLVAADWNAESITSFANTGLLRTADTVTIGALAAGAGADTTTADMNIQACPDMSGIANPEIMFTILDRNLTGATGGSRSSGDFAIGAPLMVTVESDEAGPTLSFSPTDVTINEGESTESVLLAEGPNAGEVGMVRLMVEGDAMVSLMQDGEMLEEMDGMVYVDLDGKSSARVTAMSHSDPDLMDGDTAYKAWKLMDGAADGVNIGEGYWLRVDVMGSTAVPALPLVGQLLLALFLMAGGSRLYRRRRG